MLFQIFFVSSNHGLIEQTFLLLSVFCQLVQQQGLSYRIVSDNNIDASRKRNNIGFTINRNLQVLRVGLSRIEKAIDSLYSSVICDCHNQTSETGQAFHIGIDEIRIIIFCLFGIIPPVMTIRPRNESDILSQILCIQEILIEHLVLTVLEFKRFKIVSVNKLLKLLFSNSFCIIFVRTRCCQRTLLMNNKGCIQINASQNGEKLFF